MDVRDTIMDILKNQERSMAWLSKKTGIGYYTIYQILKQKTTRLSPERLSLIKKALNIKLVK